MLKPVLQLAALGVVGIVLFKLASVLFVPPLLHRLGVTPIMEGSAVRGVITESKAGREAILAKRVIDATGDADLATRAGAPVHGTVVAAAGGHGMMWGPGVARAADDLKFGAVPGLHPALNSATLAFRASAGTCRVAASVSRSAATIGGRSVRIDVRMFGICRASASRIR